jgi:hypothetical protein
MIWKFAADQKRLVELRIINPPIRQKQQSGFRFAELQYPSSSSRRKPSIITTVPSIPPILHICHESRLIGLAVYQKISLGGYFNFGRDILVISPDIFPCLGWHSIREDTCFPLLRDNESVNLQHIGFYFPTLSDNAWDARDIAKEVYWMVQCLSHLHSVTFLSDRNIKEYFCREFSSEFIRTSRKGSLIRNYQQINLSPKDAPRLRFQEEQSLRTPQRLLRCRHYLLLYTCPVCERHRFSNLLRRHRVPDVELQYFVDCHDYSTPIRYCSNYPKFF